MTDNIHERGAEGRGCNCCGVGLRTVAAAVEAVEAAESAPFIHKSIRQFSTAALAESRLPDGRLPQVVVVLRQCSVPEYSHCDSQTRLCAVSDPGIFTASTVKHTNSCRRNKATSYLV